MSKKILFIVEGINDEPDVIKKVMEICYPKEKYEYAVCEKNIHMLIADLKDKNGNIDEDLDIKRVIIEKSHDELEIKKLQEKYTDIILVFDLDPQNNKTEYENIKLLLNYFDESTERGKLFINYPMMQSYKHLKKNETIEDFCEKTFEILDCAKYKNHVNRNSDYKQLREYDFTTILRLLKFNITKINFLINKKMEVMDENDFVNLKQIDIFEKEMVYIEKGQVSVLNTVLTFLVDYKPKTMIRKIKNN